MSRRLVGWIRLTHPFPSILDGIVVGAVAAIAGAAADRIVVLAVSMTLLQLGIGATNDVVDAPFDAGLKRGKPIPAGLVPRQAAAALAVAWFIGGLVAAATVGFAIAGVALIVVAVGLTYDLRLKGTAWSWLPFAIGIPILPVYGWLGARGSLEPAFALLVPAAILAGAALAIGNSIVDIERDIAAGRTSVAARLGRPRAARAAAGLLLTVAAAAWVSAARLPATLSPAVGLVAVGAALISAHRADLAERSWRIEATAVAVMAVLWISGLIR